MKTFKVLTEGLLDKISKHKAVEGYEARTGEHFVNLKKGFHLDGQHAFGCETATEAAKTLKRVKPCDCERCTSND